ncbi:hypothetical protein BGZ76_003889 [Entomortierella beljakovae]|nr:hypothetical protein BGZ76_003889 [Entomortierella beljakovae]
MSKSPKHTPFTAQVLDTLDVKGHNAAKSHDRSLGSAQPPSFDSFPDIAIPSSSNQTRDPNLDIPSFSSFPVDFLSTRQLASSHIEDKIPKEEKDVRSKESKESKEKKNSKRDDRDRGHGHGRHDDTPPDSHKKRSGDNRYHNDDTREKKRESKRSSNRSRSRDRSSHHDKTDKYSRNRDRDDEKYRSKSHVSSSSSKRRESSRDGYSDRHHQSRSEDRGHRDSRRSDHHKSSRSSKHGSERTRGDSRSPDRKRSRHNDVDDNESWAKRRDRDREQDTNAKSTQQGRLTSQWGRKAEENHKPGEWIIDLKGDPDAHRYGGPNPSTFPRYHRDGGGRILGVPSFIRIDFEKTRAAGNKAIVLRDTRNGSRHKSIRYADPHATWKDRSQEYKRISRAKAEEVARTLNLEKEDPSFISLNIKLGTKSKDSNESESEEQESDSDTDNAQGKKVDYRDIHGKSVYKEEDEDLLQTTSDREEEGAESAFDVLMRRRMILDGELRKDPKQPEKWLEFIIVEDNIDLISNRRSASSVLEHSTSHYEVKLSIFERALESNPANEHLWLEYMNTCRHCWEPAKVLSKWDEILQSPTLQSVWPGLWIEYLDFRQRHFLSFSVKSFAQVLEDALDRLSRVARSTRLNAQKDKEESRLQAQLVKIEVVMVHVMARTWTFLKEAGYIERAQAIVQGQVEFLFSMPPSLTTESLEIQIGSLEEYWDSELPRFGEKDAKGWNHYVTEEDEVAMENLLETAKLPSLDAPTGELIKAFAENNVERYNYSRWANMEKILDTICWFPIRTTEDMPDQLEDDPYGIIIFDDVRPFITPLFTPEARQQYVDCLFNFLGIPMNTSTGSNGPRSLAMPKAAKSLNVYNPFFHDSLLMDIGIKATSALEDISGLKRFFPEVESKENLIVKMMKEIEREQEFLEPDERNWNCIWTMPVKSFPHDPSVIFGRIRADAQYYSWATVSSHDELQQSNKLFIRNVLQQFVEVVPLAKDHRRSLSLYHLMFEAFDTLSASKGQKLAKKYLKVDRMDLEMWNGYAQAEIAFGRISEARKVYTTTLSMYQSFPKENQTRVPLIYRYFAELEWTQDRPGVALAILLSYAENTNLDISDDDSKDLPIPTPTRLIKARQFYSQKVAQLNLIRPLETGVQQDSTRVRWFEPALDLIVCFAWFEYLSTPSNTGLQSGIKVFENVIQELDFRNPDIEIEVPIPGGSKSKSQNKPLSFSFLSASSEMLLAEAATTTKKICTSVEVEMLWIQLAKLVFFHTLKATSSKRRPNKSDVAGLGGDTGHHNSEGGGFQPRDLRRVIQAGLERFPNCTLLQSLFFWSEAKQRIHGRVRTWVNEQIMRSQGAIQTSNRGFVGGPLASKAQMWIFGLFYELWSQDPYSSPLARSILESALESSKSSSYGSSPALWLIYIELELRESVRAREASQRNDKSKKSSTPDTEIESSTRVKQLLLRSVNDCPWCKDLYLIAFEPRMRQLFSLDELDQLYQTMLEKEIRIRHEIPERDPVQITQRQDKDDSDDDVDMEG